MMTDQEFRLQLADVLTRQSELNQAIAQALQAISLQADRYDAELSEIRDGLAELDRRLARVEVDYPGFSRRVAG